jgi:precorrin-2/cobalt-factor-2 C20-methyltransferase
MAAAVVPYVVPYVGRRRGSVVKKTSVYLPDALKGRLAAVATRTGRSEAQLIRSAVERLVSSEPAFGPIGRTEDPVVQRHRREPALVGLGMGPGDPGLVTMRTVAELRGADRVLAPSTNLASMGRSEIIVREVAPEVIVERVGFVMEVDSAARTSALVAAAERVVAALDAGERVAFVTLGDPNVYSTFSSLADEVRARRPGVPIETVPGIMAFQDLAARSGTVLVDGDERLVLVPARAGSDPAVLAAAAGDPSAALVVYKGGGRLPELAKLLARTGRLDGAVLGELLGLPGGRVAKVADVADRPATYLATVVVPPVREGGDASPATRPRKRAVS